MIRLFTFILKLAVVIALAVWLADRPGEAHIEWHGYVIRTSAAFFGFCALLLGFAFFIIFRLYHLVLHGPEIWRLRRRLKKIQDGQNKLTQGFIAVAAGNAPEAGKHALHARKLLGGTPATHLLQAQAAQLAGDRSAAHNIYLALAGESDSAVLGYRGLIMEALRKQDWTEVDRLAEKLRRLRPETPWLNMITFQLATRKQDWDEARAALDRLAATRLIPPEQLKRYQAALHLASAQNAAKHGNHAQALQNAERAAKLAPDWLPASIVLAQAQMEAGARRAAARTIERAFARDPHPQLVAAYRAARDGDPLEAYRQAEKLLRGHEDDPGSRLMLAEAALAADIWGEARRHLLALNAKAQATQAAYRMLARLERRESGNEHAALQWMTRAIDAPLDPVWLCRSCGGAHEEWQAVCRHCGVFNMCEWQSPGQSRSLQQGGGSLADSDDWTE